MAQLSKNILGELRGKAGLVVFKKFNGKIIAQVRPEKYKYSKSKKAVGARNRFSVATALAKHLNGIPDIKLIWKKSKIKGLSAYHKILKENAPLCFEKSASLNNKITPGGFFISVKKIDFRDLTLKIKTERPALTPAQKTRSSILKLHLLMFLSDSGSKLERRKPAGGISDYKIFNFTKKMRNYDFGIDNEWNFEFDKPYINLISKYKIRIIYLAAVLKDNDENIITYSSTFSMMI